MKKVLPKIIFLFSLSIFLTNVLYASTYYISPAGNDTSAGATPATAWQTIAKVNGLNILPGDTFLFEGGQTFNGYIVIDSSDANDSTGIVTFSSYGTGKAIINSGDSIGFYAHNTQGFTISNLIFQGSGIDSNKTNGIYLYADLDSNVKFTNIVFSHVEIFNYGGIGLDIGAGPADASNTGFKNILMDSVHVHDVKTDGIAIWGVWDTYHIGNSHQNTEIRNTLVHDVPGFPDPSWQGSGIVIAEVDSGVIEHCVAYNNGTANSACGGPVGIWAYDCNNITIQFCESHHNSSGTSGCDGGGFDFDGGETNSIMQYNYSHDNAGYGYESGQFGYARPMFNNVFRYNISENDGQISGGGLSLFKGDPSTMTGSFFYQNTVYLSPSASNISKPYGFNIVLWDSPMDSVLVYNNIFQTKGSKDSIALIEIPATYNAYFAGNLYWTTGDTINIIYHDTTYTTLASWRAATGNEMVNSSPTGIFADPLLTNAGNGGTVYPNPPDQLNAYKLPANSPAVNSGLNLMTLFGINAGGRDFFNNAAPIGAPDVGAYESSVLTAINSPYLTSYNISAFPNPVKAGDMIQIISDELFSAIELVSATGISIWKEENIKTRSISIPTKNLVSGIYFIRTTDNTALPKALKLIIE